MENLDFYTKNVLANIMVALMIIAFALTYFAFRLYDQDHEKAREKEKAHRNRIKKLDMN